MPSWEMSQRLAERVVCAERPISEPQPHTAGLEAGQQLRPFKEAR
jgi:hypothetical protein